MAEPDTAYYRMFVSACQAAGFSPTVAHYADEWDSGAGLVAHGLGINLLPRLVPMHRTAEVVRFPLAGRVHRYVASSP